jgi:sugar phosphate isomerase/epimerase
MGYLDDHLSPYMGDIVWDSFLQGLRDIHYRGDLSFETFRVLQVYPPELHEDCLRLIANTGKLFRDKLFD